MYGKWTYLINAGQGKISAPIPFPDDDEFPIRSPGSGIATPLGKEPIGPPLRGSIAEELDNMAVQTGIPASRAVDPKLSNPALAGPTQPYLEPQIRRSFQPSALRNSETSMPSASSAGKPQRKKSSFRSALGRLFGKKSKNSGSSSPQAQIAGGGRADQHRSVRAILSVWKVLQADSCRTPRP